MPVTRVPSFAPWGSPPQRTGRRRDNPKGREPVRRNRRTKPFSVMAFKSLHDFNLETFGTEVMLTLASVTTGESFGYFICVNFARVIFLFLRHRRRSPHARSTPLPKPKSSVLMSSHLSENSGVGICEIRKTVRRKASNRKCKAAFVRMRSSKKEPSLALSP